MIEAELKARVKDVASVKDWLGKQVAPEAATYQDVYYDRDDEMTGSDRELRVRTVSTAQSRRSVLTYKQARVDEASGSKPEHETEVSNPEAVASFLLDTGYTEYVRLTKHCQNYAFQFAGYEVLATLVHVPELDGAFLEVETLVSEARLHAALEALGDLLRELGLENELESGTYTDAILAARSR
ncbi:class IV adenylate cyclase [Glycomyces albidus]|uniref:CYTH domain-containing protein n=1 Tax=Glycomyces albidus TaxID=2656774 RepID=A0A6L5GH86_9ACTN|nr:class IV adenylate cyclase [Glycomyces albidus]MQM28971.1 CYTH domain-containing protein [Glycomyces albidus]